MLALVKRIWSDPVWSKVIAVAILGIIAWSWAKVAGVDWWVALLRYHPVPGWAVAITLLIVLLLVLIAISPLARPKTRSEIGDSPSAIMLTLVDTDIRIDTKWTYPLKYFLQFRNDSQIALDVSLLDYIPESVELQKKLFEVIQVKWSEYVPKPIAAARVAVYPGQMMQLFLALDPKSNPGIDVVKLKGHFGTLILSVNNQRYELKL